MTQPQSQFPILIFMWNSQPFKQTEFCPVWGSNDLNSYRKTIVQVPGFMYFCWVFPLLAFPPTTRSHMLYHVHLYIIYLFHWARHSHLNPCFRENNDKFLCTCSMFSKFPVPFGVRQWQVPLQSLRSLLCLVCCQGSSWTISFTNRW